jgi:hypothetical protein
MSEGLTPNDLTGGGTGTVLVELSAAPGSTPVSVMSVARSLKSAGFTVDEDYGVIPIQEEGPEDAFIVRGELRGSATTDQLEQLPGVVRVWRDTPIAPF